jgi:GntR family transcriptional repressor for pyruvate dehydrogenase complex
MFRLEAYAMTGPTDPEDQRVGTASRTIGRSEKVSEAVARELVRDVATNQLPPGTKLPPESVMLETFGVGRGSLREALRILEIHGLVSMRPGPRGGPVVEAVDSSDFARMASLFFFLNGSTYGDLLEARRVMDPVMAKLAAERRDKPGLHRLEEVLELSRTQPDASDAAWLHNSSTFHLVVAGMSGNLVLDLLGRALMDVWMRRLEHVVYAQPARTETVHTHEKIAQAIVDGDGDRAHDLMFSHMNEFIEYANRHYPGLFAERVAWIAPLRPRRDRRSNQ